MINQGLKQGVKQGLQQGVKQGLIEGIELALVIKYGEESQKILPQIQKIRDIEKLRKIKEAIKISHQIGDINKIIEKKSMN